MNIPQEEMCVYLSITEEVVESLHIAGFGLALWAHGFSFRHWYVAISETSYAIPRNGTGEMPEF